MRLGAVVVWLAIVALAACTTSDEGGSAEDDSFTLPSRAGADGKSPPLTAGRSLTGVLSWDDIEGGCAFLLTADGTRYEVLYPEGWSLDRAEAVLRGPAGEVVHGGETVTVRGSIASGRSSICQVGPIFAATAVEFIPG